MSESAKTCPQWLSEWPDSATHLGTLGPIEFYYHFDSNNSWIETRYGTGGAYVSSDEDTIESQLARKGVWFTGYANLKRGSRAWMQHQLTKYLATGPVVIANQVRRS